MKALLERYLGRGALEGEHEGGSAAAAGDGAAASTEAQAAAGTTILTEKKDGDGKEAEKKPEQEGQEKEKEKTGEVEKKDDKAANDFLGAVEAYDIKTPEGYDVDEEIKGEFTTAAKEIGLSQKGVERLVAIQTKMQENQAARTAAMVKDWDKQTRADKEIGGKDFEANAASAREFLSQFADEDVNVLLDRTGLGNHPAVVKMFVRAGKAMGEAKVMKGDTAKGKPDAATILYG